MFASPPAHAQRELAQLEDTPNQAGIQLDGSMPSGLPSSFDSGAETNFSEPNPPEYLGGIDVRDMAIRTVLSSVLMLGACFAGFILLKQWAGKGIAQNGQDRQIKVIDTLNLAHRCQLRLIRIDNQKVLVGFDAAGLKAVLPLSSFTSELREFENVVPSRSLGSDTDLAEGNPSCLDHAEAFYGESERIRFPNRR